MDDGMKSGMGCGALIALVVGLAAVAISTVNTAVEKMVTEKAAYVRAQAEYEIAAAAARQMDAATAAVMRDTEAAHSLARAAPPWILVGVLGVALVAVLVVVFAFILSELQAARQRELVLLAALGRLPVEVDDVAD